MYQRTIPVPVFFTAVSVVTAVEMVYSIPRVNQIYLLTQLKNKKKFSITHSLIPWGRAFDKQIVSQSSSSQTFRNSRVYYRFKKSPPSFRTLSQMYPIQPTPSYCLNIHFNIILPFVTRSFKFYLFS
jgi:hypothetical protein